MPRSKETHGFPYLCPYPLSIFAGRALCAVSLTHLGSCRCPEAPNLSDERFGGAIHWLRSGATASGNDEEAELLEPHIDAVT